MRRPALSGLAVQWLHLWPVFKSPPRAQYLCKLLLPSLPALVGTSEGTVLELPAGAQDDPH